jgi:hypothetical protein
MSDAVFQGRENAAVNRAMTPLEQPNITGMKLNSDIVLGDMVLNTIDENRVVWVCTDIQGWWGHPDPEMKDFQRGFADGSYDVRGRWNARDITLEGSFLCPDPSLVAISRDKLIRATNLVYRGDWLRTYEDPPRAAFVRLSGRPDIETVNARGRVNFSIGLRAADPIKYEWNDQDPEGYSTVEITAQNASTGAAGEGVVNNIGNADVSAIFEIEGPLVGPASLLNVTTGQLILIIDSIPEGSFLEIDTYDRSVALDGSTEGARSIIETLVDWITLQPGQNAISLVDEGNPNSTATLRVYYRSGWIG